MGYTILFLQPDNPCNTEIVDELGQVVYTVETDLTNLEKPITRVIREKRLVAEWEWRSGLRSDRLMYGDVSQKASNWLKKSFVPFKDTATFHDRVQGVEYKWENIAPGVNPQLLGPNSKEPVARFERAIVNGSVSSRLYIGDSVKGIRDDIVVSFLLIERKRRMSENEAVTRAYAIAIPAVAPYNP